MERHLWAHWQEQTDWLCVGKHKSVFVTFTFTNIVYGVGKEGESPEFSGALHHQQSYLVKKYLGNLLNYYRSRNQLKRIF